MSFIGNTTPIASENIVYPDIQFFSGNGTTTSFQLNRQARSVASIVAVVNNVVQKPGDAFAIDATNRIVFTQAPSTGTNNIYVKYDSIINTLGSVGYATVGTNQIAFGAVTADKIPNGSITRDKTDVGSLTGTGALALPTGATGQRPAGQAGLLRFNTTTNNLEYHNNSGWGNFGSLAFLNQVGTAEITGWGQSATANGWVRFPGGLIMQWCTGGSVASETDITVTFPIAFPSQCLNVMLGTQMPSGDRDGMFQLRSFNNTSCLVRFNQFNSAGGTGQPLVWAWGI